ncbi:long-chain fatty acid--CoA ligase, partial [candidate division KSB1 bacterium]
APLSPETEHFLREAGFPYAIGYGLTETSPLIAGCAPSETKFRSTGPAVSDVRIRIDNPDPVTGEGEIVVKGPNVMKGYYKDPDRTKEVFTKDGWFRTGDLGVMDSDGYVFIKGRLKNMILGPSGENIYPEEIEAHLNENEYVLESLVYKHDDKIVARVHLNYELIDKTITKERLSESKMHEMINELLESIKEKVNNRVSRYSRIHLIIEQPEPFEKTPTKKIKRYLYIN